MTRALLLLLALAAAPHAQDGPAAVAVLDASALVDVPLGDATAAARTVAVTCPALATCRLMASVEGRRAEAVAVTLAAVATSAPEARAQACDASAPCALVTGLPAGTTTVALDLSAESGPLAPAGAHALSIRLWVLADPFPGGLEASTLLTPHPSQR